MSGIRQYHPSIGLPSGVELTPTSHCPEPRASLSRLAPLLVLTLGALAAVHCLADSWLQPTAIGLLWGALFLLGCGAGSGLVGSLKEAFGCGVIAYLCWHGVGRLCDIPLAENLIILAILGGNGWISGRVLTRRICPMTAGSPDRSRTTTEARRRSNQWSLADMLSLTTFVGCLAWGIPRLMASPGLMSEVWLTLLAVLLGSLLATAWVWTDRWSIRRLAILTALLMCLLAAVALGPASENLRQILAAHVAGPAPNFQGAAGLAAIREAMLSPLYLCQVLTGPAAVVAAQGLSVMVVQGWWRWLNRFCETNRHALEPNSAVKLCLPSLD